MLLKVRFQYELLKLNILTPHVSTGTQKRLDYEIIVPQIYTLQFLYSLVEKLSINWSEDCFLVYSELSFHNFDVTNTLTYHYELTFYSPIKKMRIKTTIINFNFKEDKFFETAEYSFHEDDKQNKPFFHKPYWREAFIYALKSSESDMFGKKFRCLIQNIGDDIYMHFGNTREPVGRSRVFWLRGNKLTEETNVYKAIQLKIYE